MYSSRNSIHHPLICPIKDSQIQLSFKSKSEREEHLNRPGSQSYKMDNFITVSPRSQNSMYLETLNQKKGQKKPLTGEILRSMKCEVKPKLTRPSGSTQEMRGLRNQTPGIKRKQGNSFFQVSTKKATPPNHIHKRNKFTEKSSAHLSLGNLVGACNVLKCLCCIICCVQYTKALFEGTLRPNKPRKKTC